jgi:hypothetical protein
VGRVYVVARKETDGLDWTGWAGRLRQSDTRTHKPAQRAERASDEPATSQRPASASDATMASNARSYY